MHHIRKRLTYANAMSSIAVFLVIGGATAFAALAKNSVGTKQLKKNAVNGSKVKNGSLTGADINLGTLGTVPSATNATHATNADNATNATHATNADNATNASKLGGNSPASYESKAFEARNDGFVNMPEGVETTLQTLSLPAGRYLILARVDLNNNGGNTLSTAGTCVLEAGTTSHTYEIPGLFATSGPGDRYAMMVQIVSTLGAAGQAALRCTPTWTSGNGVDPTITAISVQP